MTYVMILLQVVNGNFMVTKEIDYVSLSHCITMKNAYVKQLGYNKVNYEVICAVKSNDNV